MRSILISIRPKWIAKILSGEKIVEIRTTAPKRENLPADVYIYCTKGDYIGHVSNKLVGKVVAKFRLWLCDCGDYKNWLPFTKNEFAKSACLPIEEIERYVGDKRACFWHISDLKIFDAPKELDEFGLKRPPQSWQFIEVE